MLFEFSRACSYTTLSAYRRTKSFFKGSKKKRERPWPNKCKYFATLELQFVPFLTLQNEKESLSQQLKESLDALNQLSHVPSKEPDLHKSQDVLGKLLAEKFNLEDQVFTKLVNSTTSGQPNIFPPK